MRSGPQKCLLPIRMSFTCLIPACLLHTCPCLSTSQSLCRTIRRESVVTSCTIQSMIYIRCFLASLLSSISKHVYTRTPKSPTEQDPTTPTPHDPAQGGLTDGAGMRGIWRKLVGKRRGSWSQCQSCRHHSRPGVSLSSEMVCATGRRD